MTTTNDIGQARGQQERPIPVLGRDEARDEQRSWLGGGGGGARGDGERFINVGSSERTWSTYGGGALLALGLAKGRISGLALAALGGAMIYRGVTGHCPMYSQLGKSTVDDERDAAQPEEYFKRGIHVVESITVNKPREELYRYWRQLENLPRIMHHLESVQVIDERRSHWVAKGPAGARVEWDAEVINDVPNERIAWRSLGGAEVDNAGSVRFLDAPGDRGTQVTVTLDYIPPAGGLGYAIAKLLGRDAKRDVHEDLRGFKRTMEVGEQPTVVGQPRGTCTGHGTYQE
jgi:uncharacterized membrane protein